MIKIILQKINPTEGNSKASIKKSIYIDQDYSLIENEITVYEQAQKFNSSGLQEHDIKMKLNKFLFSQNDWNKPCAALSGGEKMRLMLCCLTINNQSPDIIILDEPTTHLDLVHKATLLKLLQKLTHETGKTILYSTHDIDLAIQMTDEMIVFTPTQIVQDQPCNLIQTGIFNTLFDTEHLIFDASNGKFKIK